ncbi:hypothetical protein JOQ06_029027 [Pogonophryne albipinna]|uniref:Uncharacterized protein n=1 Tax=Pogonophryne albipinna TaxID=1090488 RepID=A0AAD6FN21_9TELE|nr:hypothetical protein JOQ06_029027 [Pogonophryne albipinna]
MGANTEKRSKCKHEREDMRDREGSEAGRGVCGLQLAEGFPEPTASVEELLNNFTGLSERSFKSAKEKRGDNVIKLSQCITSVADPMMSPVVSTWLLSPREPFHVR